MESDGLGFVDGNGVCMREKATCAMLACNGKMVERICSSCWCNSSNKVVVLAFHGWKGRAENALLGNPPNLELLVWLTEIGHECIVCGGGVMVVVVVVVTSSRTGSRAL